MLEAVLRGDGSVADVRWTDERGSSAPGGRTDGIFPIDGLPRANGTPLHAPSASGESGGWSGGFSFAAWDREHDTLRAYRDHYGARPLYFHAQRGKVLLSGDIPALLERTPSARLDEIAVAEYLATGAPTENRTFHEGIGRVPAASALHVGHSGVKVARYWSPWDGPRSGGANAEDLDAEFRSLFRDAVHSTLDGVPSAAFLLSGGPDSSSVLGMAGWLARQGILPPETLRVALTLAFDETRSCDEGALARESAGLWKIPWRPVPVEDTSPLYGMERFLRSHGEPPCTANLAIELRLFEAARDEGAGVVLDGHDADVLFSPSGGYLSELARRFRWTQLAREAGALHRKHGFSATRIARETLAPFRPPFRGKERLPGWIRPDFARRTNLLDRIRSSRHRAGSFEEREAMRVLAPSVGLSLEATRTAERLCGVEGAHPYFDPALIRFLVAAPLRHRFSEGETKILMRRALADLLTPAVRKRNAKTNYHPYFEWSLRRHLGPRLDRFTERRNSYVYEFVDSSRVSSMISLQLRGGRTNSLAVWRMIAVDQWLAATRPS